MSTPTPFSRIKILTAALASLAVSALASRAAAMPQFLLYQGRYLNAGVATTGTVPMEFRITNGATLACATAANGTTLFWTSGAQTVATSSGVFSYKLGLQTDQVTQDPAFTTINWASPTTTFYLDVCVSGASLVPHEPIGSGVFAIYASSAGSIAASGLTAGALPANVIASSIAVNSIANANQLAPSLVIPDANLPTSLGAKTFTGAITTVSSVTASAFFGDGSHLTGVAGGSVSAAAVGAGTLPANVIASSIAVNSINNANQLAPSLAIPDANLPTSLGAKTFTGAIAAVSSVTASAFFGDGSHLTSLSASSLTGAIADARLSANVPLLSGSPTFTGGVTAASFTGNGSGLTGVIQSQTGPAQVANFSITGNGLVGGNMGVGTTSPGAPLDVNGAAQFGSGVLKSTFSVAGDLTLAVGAHLQAAALFGTVPWTIGGSYCGANAGVNGSLVSGAKTGYAAAAAICAVVCGGTGGHLCSAEELVRSVSAGITVGAGPYWYAGGVASGTNTDCAGYTSALGTVTGSSWSSGAPIAPTACNTTMSMACCR